MKKRVLVSLIFLFSFFLHAEVSISEECENLLKDFFSLRLELAEIDPSVTEGVDEIISKIENFVEKNKDKIERFPEEEKLIIGNFYVNEKYNYLYEIPSQKEYVRGFLKEQLEKNEAFFSGKNIEDYNKWLIASKADVTSCYMGFSVSDVMKYGLTIRPMYEAAIAQDSSFAYGLLNLAQWYYWAPGISGGSKKKALTFLEKSYEAASTEPEKYYTALFYSQLLFENRKFDDAGSIFAEALKCCPESYLLKTVQRANENGLSMFEYNRRKSNLKDADKKQ